MSKKKTNPVPESVLLEAHRISAGGERMENYGKPKPNHDRIAILWNGFFAARAIQKDGTVAITQPELSARDVATMMILLKIARDMHCPKRDNCVDIAGYARCLSSIDGHEP